MFLIFRKPDDIIRISYYILYASTQLMSANITQFFLYTQNKSQKKKKNNQVKNRVVI